METWYKTGGYRNRIEPTEVVKETDKFLTVVETRIDFGGHHRSSKSRTAKHSNYNNYFPTYREAYEFILNKKEGEIIGLKARLKSCESDLVDFVREYKIDTTKEGIDD